MCGLREGVRRLSWSWLRRRSAAELPLAVLLGLACVAAALPAFAQPAVVRAGLLKYGTVQWEVETMLKQGIDRRHGVSVVVMPFASEDASAIALQSDAVDIIVSDYIWVSRQRHAGADFTFVPHSMAVGAVLVRPDSPIHSLEDLEGRTLGVAGGALDKTWLLLRAAYERQHGRDLAEAAEVQYATPPLVAELMRRGDLPAAINFWHYNSRLKAEGMRELVSVDDILSRLDVPHRAPLLGWVFREQWAREHPKAISGFLEASAATKHLLATDDQVWNSLRPLMDAGDDATFDELRRSYRAGIPKPDVTQALATAKRVYAILAETGGEALVGRTAKLAPGTFWHERD